MKSDLQRLAFFIPSLGFVFAMAWLSFVVAVPRLNRALLLLFQIPSNPNRAKDLTRFCPEIS
ncbi:hypothetical protein F6450_00010 [Photobacterium damselae subsp. damselae]|uniref:Uncharacterized protein n=1 Tax=Photobacterium damselae subsp. damselae TaxID=85581 RepID=A0AAD3X1Q5_PHODD|nr:hypothetical protein F6450_00010 [Photobacterium damselae subsp. damselae]